MVRTVVDELERKLANRLRQAVSGSLNRAARNNRPRHNEIDWLRTIRANLRHYQMDYQTIIPERRIGFARKSRSLRDIVLCVDQSGSMAPSVVYASVFAAVLASMKAVSTQVVVFDTVVVDLTPLLHDPVEVLLRTQLGGGTDIDQALAYCQGLVKLPQETLALDDHGAPSYDRHHAVRFAQMGIPCFACTPDKFPDLMAAAIKKQDVSAWAARQDIAIAG